MLALVSQTSQTILLAGSTLAAVIITFIGSYYLLRWQTRKEARERRDRAVSEVLAAANDLINGLQVFRAAHEARTTWRYYLHVALTFLPELGKLTGWQDLGRWAKLESLYSKAIEFSRYRTEQRRLVVLDLSDILQTRLNRYMTAAGILALGEDKRLADAVRDLTTKVTELPALTTGRTTRVASAIVEAQQALARFASVVDKYS